MPPAQRRRGRPGGRTGGALVLLLAASTALARPPVADVHVHFNADHQATITAREAIGRLRGNDVVLAVVSGTPPDLALTLRRAGGRWVIPLFMPYLEPQRRHDWFADARVLPAARRALAGGGYFGLGEIHLTGGLSPSPRRRHPVVDGLFELAAEFAVPILVHTEASSYRYLLPLCQRHRGVRILWAHAGGLLPPAQVGRLLEACPGVSADLAARDQERYVDTPITSAGGALLPAWRALLGRFPGRFMIGSDPVWPVDEPRWWDEPDTGWLRIGRYLDFHRRYLADLDRRLARRLRLDNAVRFFRVEDNPAIELRDAR